MKRFVSVFSVVALLGLVSAAASFAAEPTADDYLNFFKRLQGQWTVQGKMGDKTAEGTLKLVGGLLRQVFSSSLSARLGYLLARPGLDRLREWLDPRRYNGAVMLGLNGVVVKSHGGTDASGFAHAVDVGMDMVVHRFNDRMREGLARIVSLQGGADASSGVGPKDGPGSGNGGPRLAAAG